MQGQQWWDNSLARVSCSFNAAGGIPLQRQEDQEGAKGGKEPQPRVEEQPHPQAEEQPQPQAEEQPAQPRPMPQLPSPSTPSCKAPPAGRPLGSSVARRFVEGPDACLLGGPDACRFVYVYYHPDGRPRTQIWFASDAARGHGRWLGQEVSEDPGHQDHMAIYEHVCSDRWRLVWW